MTRVLMTAALTTILAVPTVAQERPEQPPAAATPQAPAMAIAPPEPPATNTNIRIELTITDQRADGAPVTKTVTATVTDRSVARIRTSGSVRTPLGFRDVILNVDTSPQLVTVSGAQKLRLNLTIEYRPVAAESDTEKTTTPVVNETLTVVLDDGKSMVISQSADPATDRKVKVEAKATILR